MQVRRGKRRIIKTYEQAGSRNREPVPARREGVPMSSEKPVLSTVANKVARVVMNRPGALNAMLSSRAQEATSVQVRT